MAKTFQELRTLANAALDNGDGITSHAADLVKAEMTIRMSEERDIIDGATAAGRGLLRTEHDRCEAKKREGNELAGMLTRFEENTAKRAKLPVHQLEGRGGSNRGGSRKGRLVRPRAADHGREPVHARRGDGAGGVHAGSLAAPLGRGRAAEGRGARHRDGSQQSPDPGLAADSVASWTAEGAEITESSPTMSGVDAILHKCASNRARVE